MAIRIRFGSKSRRAIFAATLDYNTQARARGLRLERAGAPTGAVGREGNFDFEKLEGAVKAALKEELPKELEEIYNLKVKIEVLATRDGSLVAIFSAMVVAYGLISGYKDLWESVPLLRKHAAIVLHKVSKTFSPDIEVDVELLKMPPMPSRHRVFKVWGHANESGDFFASGFYPSSSPDRRRDGFFWFLLVATVLLFSFLVALVSGAVIRTYF